MPRFLSAVTALSSSLPTVRIQTCRTFFASGAIQASLLPSGESFGEVFSGFPKRMSREISGGSSPKEAVALANNPASTEKTMRRRERRGFMSKPP
jgi:hypothetical protein